NRFGRAFQQLLPGRAAGVPLCPAADVRTLLFRRLAELLTLAQKRHRFGVRIQPGPRRKAGSRPYFITRAQFYPQLKSLAGTRRPSAIGTAIAASFPAGSKTETSVVLW